jgi:hypothetical protein
VGSRSRAHGVEADVKEHDVHVNVKMPAWMVQMIDARRKEGESRSSTVRRLLLAGIMEVQDD